ncbi:MAG: hypothetical protein HY825_07390 [Acidobacteria bacterium]|nr:hypothetical protein [Acidobacteriota bacterium]
MVSLELEASLVKKPQVYLVLDPPRRALEVRSRGHVLDVITLAGIEVVTQQPLLGAGTPPVVPVPAIWTVKSGPGDTDREIIAPDSLRPMPKEGEEEEEASPTPAPPGPTPTATPVPEPPASYRAQLDTGWDLWVCEALPASGFWPRLTAAVRDGWARLRGGGEDLPPALALAMSSDDAKRIHHLLRVGMPILVVAGAS